MGWLSGVGVATTGDFYGPDAGASLEQAYVGTFGDSSQPTGTTIGSINNDRVTATPGDTVNMVPGLKGINPLFYIPLILGTIVLVRVIREWGEKDGEVKEARAGIYFGFMASLWSVLLIPLYKALLRKYHFNGLSEYVENA